MNRIPILAGGAVAAAIVLAVGAVTVANAMSGPNGADVLQLNGVSTSSSATPSPSDDHGVHASPTPSPSGSHDANDDHGGIHVVSPSDPTKISDDDPATHDLNDDHGGANSGSGSTNSGSGSTTSGSDDSGSGHGGHGGDDDASGHH